MRFEAGSKFAGYTVVSRLGRGGMATVYLVREEGLDRLVALKVLPEQLVDDQQFGARFEQEARVIGSMDHPHIIPVYRYGITDDVPWMALRYVDGGDFAARLLARPLALAEGFAILRGVASALDYAHRKGVVHRDIKPQNILLTGEGSSYLADFGVAKLLQSSGVAHTLVGGIVGSPAYMAPEQAQGHAIGPHTDIYSLAVICFQWLTGSLPFVADTPHATLLKHVLEPLPTEALGLLAPAVAAALQRGMAKQPEDRFATAGNLISALEQAMYAPLSQSMEGLPVLTPSGLRAVGSLDGRLDTPTTLSRLVTPPMVRTPTTPASRPAPIPQAEVVVDRAAETARTRAVTAATPILSPIAHSAADADMTAAAPARRPLVFAAMGAALFIAAYAAWRLLGADAPTSDSASPAAAVPTAAPAVTDEASTASTAPSVVAEAPPEIAPPTEASAVLIVSAPKMEPAPPTEMPADEAERLAQEQRDAATRAESARAAKLLQQQRVASQRDAERLAAEQRAAAAAIAAVAPAPAPAPAPAIPKPTVVAGFVQLGDGVIEDTRTGLQWTRTDNGVGVYWTGAKQRCKSLGSGWRLPTSGELQGIAGSSAFALSGSTFWTSSRVGLGSAYVVDIKKRKAESASIDNRSPRALCARKP